MLVEDGTARPLTNELVYPRLFQKSRYHPRRLFVGTEAGLRIVDVDGDDVRLSASFGEADSAGLLTVLETAADTVWAGSQRDGAWRYQFRPDGSLSSAEQFAAAQGLRIGVQSETLLTRLLDGRVIASTREGWFVLDGNRFLPFDPAGLGTWRQDGELLRLDQSPDGEWWAFGANRILFRSEPGEWRSEHVARFGLGKLVDHHFVKGGRVALVGEAGLLLRSGESIEPPLAKVLLRSLTAVNDDGRRTSLTVDTPSELPVDSSGLEFSVALPDLNNVDAHRYRWRLAGYEDQFSRWSASHEGTYLHIPPGNYSLEVEAQDGLGRISKLVPFAVSVLPAWYQTLPARVAMIAAAMSLLALMSLAALRHRTRRLARRNVELEKQVARRTSELESANEALLSTNAELLASRQAVIESGFRADLIFKALNDALVGTTLDEHYRIDSRIGSGGFGTVYRAVELHMDNVVAIKVFKPVPGHDAARSLERFRAEGHSAFRVNHPNAVRVLDFGICVEAVAYLVMEYLDGDSLAERLASRGAMSVPQVLDVLVPICRVLAHAHAVDVIHRDVKPSNILLCRMGGDEVVKLIDFGIAKVIDESTPGGMQNLTATGLLMGTPNYMAPERFLDHPYDGRSDVYSLGVIAFEMLAGRRPFADIGENYVGSVMRRLQEPPPNLRGLRPDAGDDLAGLIESMLDRQADARPDAATLADRLAILRAQCDESTAHATGVISPAMPAADNTVVTPAPREIRPA